MTQIMCIKKWMQKVSRIEKIIKIISSVLEA